MGLWNSSINKYKGVNNSTLRKRLREDPLEDEEIIFEIVGKIVIHLAESTNEKSRVWFATNYRVGIVEEYVRDASDLFISSILNLRNIWWEDDASTVHLIMASKEYPQDVNQDSSYEFKYSNSESTESAVEYLMSLRFRHPLLGLENQFEQIVGQVYKNPSGHKKALKTLEKLETIDPMCGTLDVLIARTLESEGRGYEATIKIASIWKKILWFEPTILFKEFWIYPWNKAALRYLPSLETLEKESEHDRIEYHYLHGLHAISDGDITLGMNNILDAFSEYIELSDNSFEEVVDLIVSLLSLGSWINEKNLEKYEKCAKQISPHLQTIKTEAIEGGAFESEPTLKTVFEFMESLLSDVTAVDSRALNEFAKMIGEEVTVDSIAGALLEAESFDEASRVNYIKPKLEEISDWDLTTVVNLGLDIWEIGSNEQRLVYDIINLTARYREGSINPQEARESLLALKNGQDIDLLLSNNEESYLLLHLMDVEIMLLSKDKAVPLTLYNLRKAIGHAIGRCVNHPFIQHADALLEFYTAWHYKTVIDIERAQAKIPVQHPFLWFHKLADDVIKHIKKSALNSVQSETEILANIAFLVENIQKHVDEHHDIIGREIDVDQSIERIKKSLTDNEIRVSIGGETSAGKTTFLNQLFDTDLFYVTPEEATGVPTHIRFGKQIEVKVYDLKNQISASFVGDAAAFTSNNTHEQLDTVRAFIKDNTKVSENSEADRVEVFLPINNLPHDLTLIDTPGFNANESRSDIARKVIKNSHACIFVIDARNALKSGEMEVLEATREEVGKTFYILNKMDLILGDDDLDVDENSAEDTIIRVKETISSRFNLSDVMLYPVSSLPITDQPETSKIIVQPYIDNLAKLRENIFHQTTTQKLYYIIDLAVKHSVRFVDEIASSLESISQVFIEDEKKLVRSIPEDLSLFKQEIRSKLDVAFENSLGEYFDVMKQSLQEEYDQCNDGFIDWLNITTSKSDLNEKAQKRASKLIKHLISELEISKVEAQKKMVSNLIENLAVIFQELYSDLPFESSFDKKRLISSSSNLKIDTKIIHDSSEALETGTAGAVGGAAAGIAIGAILGGPVGAAIGAWVGSSMFGKKIDDMKEELYNAFSPGLDKVLDEVAENIDNEMSTNFKESFAKNLYKVIDDELSNFEKVVATEINRNEQKWQKSLDKSMDVKHDSAQILNIAETLRIWRGQGTHLQ